MNAARVTALVGLCAGLLQPLHAADVDGVSATTIRLGMVNVQSGPAAALGQGMRAGAQAVFADVNARGGVHGRRIELSVLDDGYEPDQTFEHTLRLVQEDKVLALFGYVGTPTTNAVLPLLNELKVPLVGVFSGATSLRKPLVPQVFNLRASYRQEAEHLVAHLLKEGKQKFAIVYQNDDFGLTVLAAMKAALQRNGRELRAAAMFQRNTVALKLALATMLRAEPDAIVVVGPYAPVAAFINQGRSKGLKSTFAAVSFVGTETLLQNLPDGGEGVLVSQVMPHPGNRQVAAVRHCSELLRQYQQAELTYVSLEGCANAQLMVEALQRAGPGLNRDSLAAALNAIDQLDLGGFVVNLAATQNPGSELTFLTRLVDGRIVEVR